MPRYPIPSTMFTYCLRLTRYISLGYITGITQPMSLFTVQSMLDLGYDGVNLSAAEPYTLPSQHRRRLRDPKATRIINDLYQGAMHELAISYIKPGRHMDYEREVILERDHPYHPRNAIRLTNVSG